MITAPVFIGGHSLGAAHAFLYAWSRIKRGLPVAGIYALASPNPGDSTIRQTLESHQAINGLTVSSLWNGRDYVPGVPIDIELFDEDYARPWADTEIYEVPPDRPIKLDAWHGIALYQAGAHKLPPSGAAVELGTGADLIARLYQTADGWDWISPVDGAYWAIKILPNGARLAIARGSVTLADWLDDFDARQIVVMGARVSEGFWRGVAAAQEALDAHLAA